MHTSRNNAPAGQAVDWMLKNLELKQTDSSEFIFQNTASQAGRSAAPDSDGIPPGRLTSAIGHQLIDLSRATEQSGGDSE